MRLHRGPLQVPAFEQSPPRALLATQSFFGSAPPTGTGEQVPTLPETLQLMQIPPVAASLQAVLQQTPSVQKPLAHWGPASGARTVRRAFCPQELPTQVLGGTQSLSVAQIFSHAAELQMERRAARYVRRELSGELHQTVAAKAGVSDKFVGATGGLAIIALGDVGATSRICTSRSFHSSTARSPGTGLADRCAIGNRSAMA